MTKLIPYKTWVHEEARRLHVKPCAVYMQVARGKYPWLVLEKVNMRVVLVNADASEDWIGVGAYNDLLNNRPVAERHKRKVK